MYIYINIYTCVYVYVGIYIYTFELIQVLGRLRRSIDISISMNISITRHGFKDACKIALRTRVGNANLSHFYILNCICFV